MAAEVRGPPGPRPIATVQTTLYRARCRRPVLIERVKQSLAAHGQLQPVVAVERDGRPDLVDGFKRREGAAALGWETLTVTMMPADEVGKWAMMLALNRGPQSMTELEEALVLRELVATGMTQVEVAQLVQRHRSWVSRRVGLVERLHGELVEGMKLGLLHPGVARRLLPLPPGNQLELAAAAQRAGLGPRDTELLVSLWQRAPDPEVRSYLLREPRAALMRARPELGPAPDPRLEPRSRQLLRLLRLVQGVAPRAAELLDPAPLEADLRILAPDLRATTQAASRLMTALGRVASAGGSDASGASGATSSSVG